MVGLVLRVVIGLALLMLGLGVMGWATSLGELWWAMPVAVAGVMLAWAGVLVVEGA